MKTLFYIFIFLFILQTNAQEKLDYQYQNVPLQEVLEDIETKNKVSFSFAKDVIANKFITLNSKESTYLEILDAMTAQTGLLIKPISDTQIIISIIKKNSDSSTICGYLLDAQNRFPITYAVLINTNGNTITTNSQGYFEGKSSTDNTYTVNQTGYEKTVIIISTNCSPIYVNPSAENLDQVLLIGYVTTGIDRNKDGSIDVTSNSLGILPGLVTPDLMQSIQLVPGVSTLDESATGIQIRGGSPDQNLILFDDIKLYNSGYFYGMFSAFNPYATQKATLFKSGTSAAYGDRISGIIDISTGEKIPSKLQAGFGLDGLSVDAYLKAPLNDKVAVYLFGRRSYTDLYKSPTYDSYADKNFTNFGVTKDINGTILNLETDDDFTPETSNNEFSFTDFNAKIIIKPNADNSVSISGLYTHNRLDFDFMGGDEKVVDSLSTKNKGVSTSWKHTTNDKQHEELTAYYSEYNSFYQNDELKDEDNNGVLDLEEINTRRNDITDIGLNFSSTTQINEKQKIALGYQISHTDLNVIISKEKPLDAEKESSLQDNDNLKNALFGEYVYQFKNKGFLNTGLRFVHYSNLGNFLIEPRLSFEYPLHKNFRIKAAIERRNQPISQLVEFNHTELRLENNLWRLSDGKDFPLLSSNQISSGLLFHHNKLTFDVDAYYKELKGLTTFTSGFSNPLENLEEGKSTIKGIDFLLKYKWDHYKVWAGYTFNDIIFQFPNLKDTSDKFSGNNDVTHQLRISNTLKLDKWQFSLGWQYRTGKPVTPVNNYEIKIDADGENAGVVNFGALNSDRLPDFHRLDASIIYDFKINKLRAQLGLSALNLYNRVIPLNLVYKAERKPLDDGGIAVEGTTGSTLDEREVILEQVIQRFSLGFTTNASFRLFI